MELDSDKIDEAVLALLALGRHDGYRAWKSFDWESMGRLHAKGYITDPVGNGRLPMLVIDGKEISWERFGRMVMGFEGWQFRMEIKDRSEEI